MYDIGIIGGAGPKAGALLFNRIIDICIKNYGCVEDGSFPSILHISYPFSDMLLHENYTKVTAEILDLLSFFSKSCNSFSIACNTLHSFIKKPPDNLVHLIDELKFVESNPYIICSQTSKNQKIHQKSLQCRYLPNAYYPELNQIIFQILGGNEGDESRTAIEKLLAPYRNDPILLGCTEFSLVHDRFPLNLNIIDPIDLIAKKLCFNFFKEKT
jgi:aspartate racemase